MYTTTKLLYLCNVVAQFMMMNMFLDQNNAAWGADILVDIVNGRDWVSSLMEMVAIYSNGVDWHIDNNRFHHFRKQAATFHEVSVDSAAIKLILIMIQSSVAVAFCDFTVRTTANVHRFTIQCVLMLNMASVFEFAFSIITKL